MSQFYAPIQQATTTAQSVITSASNETRGVIDWTNPAAQTLLLDWLNRVQLTLLRASRWDFLLSLPNYFITQREQTDYWVGPTQAQPNGTVDTLLNLTNVDVIQRNSVMDCSNDVSLFKTERLPFSLTLSKDDAQFRPGHPAEWRQDLFEPNILNIYPAPDNQNIWQPVPQSPLVQFLPGGSLPQRTYLVTCSFIDALGYEGDVADRETCVTIPAGFVALVKSPQMPLNITTSGVSYNQYNVYAQQIPNPLQATQYSNSELLQTLTPIGYGLDWTEPTSGLLTNTRGIPDETNLQITPLDGYIISFKYYAQRQIVAELGDVLQIPDVYFDLMVAGVTMYAFRYLRFHNEAVERQQEFMDGVRQMVKDRNMIPRESDYVGPDQAGVGIGVRVPYDDIYYSLS